MKQETFTDIKYSFRKKKTKWEEFLEIMDEYNGTLVKTTSRKIREPVFPKSDFVEA